MTQISHQQVHDILAGGPLDGGRLVYATLDIGQGDKNPTVSFHYNFLGRLFLILRKLAIAAYEIRQRQGVQIKGQPIEIFQMQLDNFEIAPGDAATGNSILRFITVEGLTFDLDVDADTLTALERALVQHLGSADARDTPTGDMKLN